MHPDSQNTSTTTGKRPALENTFISVVLPICNESEKIPQLTAKVAKAMWNCEASYEIVYVDDGSQDGSAEMLDEIAAEHHRVSVVHLSRHFGHQAAIHAGLSYAKGDAIVVMDVDSFDSPDAIPRMLERWQEGYDVVHAVRAPGKKSSWQRFYYHQFQQWITKASQGEMPAEADDYGLIDRRIAQWILALGESDRSYAGLRAWVGFKQTYLQVEKQSADNETKRNSLRRHLRQTKNDVFSFSHLPLTLFHVIGILAASVFCVVAVFALSTKLFSASAVPGWTSNVLLGSFFGAMNAIGIALLGEYIVRIYDQVRARPLYLVDRTVNERHRAISAQEPFSAVHEERTEEKTAAVADDFDADLDFEGDEPYLALIDDAMSLLQASNQLRQVADEIENLDYGDLTEKNAYLPAETSSLSHNS